MSKRVLAFLIALSPIAPAASAAPGASTPAPALDACTRIVSSLQRLACFDRVAGTPLPTVQAGLPAVEGRVPESIRAVAANERARARGDQRFRMTEAVEAADQRRVIISAPAQDAATPRPVLALSCIAAITRLQLIVSPPLARHQARIELRQDGRIVVPAQAWQVLENGRLVDAGRGLAGIEVVRHLGSGKRLEVRSDVPALDGLHFDSEGLDGLIAVQRRACKW